MTEFEYHNAGNTEAQEKAGLAWLLTQGGTPGKATAGAQSGLLVTQTGTASSSVLIAAGAGFAQNAALDGASLLVNDTQKTLDILGPNPMGATPRNDIVVFDNATLTIHNVVGTPNAVPTDPTVPGTAFALARLRHAANATTVPTANIDDLRALTAAGVASPVLDARLDALEAALPGGLRLFYGLSAGGTTNSSGFLTLTHGAGFTPSAIFVTNATPSTTFAVLWGADTYGASTVRLRFMNANGGSLSSLSTGTLRYLCIG